MQQEQDVFKVDKKILLLLFMISFTIFIFTTDAHRYTIDEDISQRQTKRIVTMTPDPLYVEGESHIGFEYSYTQNNNNPLCINAIWCSGVYLGHSLVQIPILALNHYFEFIKADTVVWTSNDFNDPHYVWWRNSIDPDFTFLELFYGPIFSSLSVMIFFALCKKIPYKNSTSVILSLTFGLTTSIWAYSQTSFNLIASSFFVLLGIFFIYKFLRENNPYVLILSGLALGFGYMVRNDVILVIGITLIFVIFHILKTHHKKIYIVNFFIFVSIPIFINRLVNEVRFDISGITGGSYIPTNDFPLLVGFTGLLFSPGVGLFIFYPVLSLCIFSFYDFFKKQKYETFFLISLILGYLIFYATFPNWHGMNAWAARYLLTIIPFMLIPLGASLEKRHYKFWIVVTALASIGFLSNIVYVIQDENWFVWGTWGSSTGLTSLGSGLAMHPATMWTFEYSQLTHSIITGLTNLQVDIFLLKLLGSTVYFITFISILVTLGFILLHHMLYKKTIQSGILNK